jgi:hypothetical protein
LPVSKRREVLAIPIHQVSAQQPVHPCHVPHLSCLVFSGFLVHASAKVSGRANRTSIH